MEAEQQMDGCIAAWECRSAHSKILMEFVKRITKSHIGKEQEDLVLEKNV